MLGQNWFRDIQVKYFRFFNFFLLKAEDSLDYKHCMQGIHLTLERLHIREPIYKQIQLQILLIRSKESNTLGQMN